MACSAATLWVWDTPVLAKNSSWWTKLKQFGLLRTLEACVTPGTLWWWRWWTLNVNQFAKARNSKASVCIHNLHIVGFHCNDIDDTERPDDWCKHIREVSQNPHFQKRSLIPNDSPSHSFTGSGTACEANYDQQVSMVGKEIWENGWWKFLVTPPEKVQVDQTSHKAPPMHKHSGSSLLPWKDVVGWGCQKPDANRFLH